MRRRLCQPLSRHCFCRPTHCRRRRRCVQIGTTLALLLAIIAGHDYPQHWPTLLDELGRHVEAPENVPADVAQLAQLHALAVLQTVVKALCARAVGLARRALAAAAPPLLALATRFVVPCGAHIVDAVARGAQPDAHATLFYEHGSKLARRLLKYAVADLGLAAQLLADELERLVALAALLPSLRELASATPTNAATSSSTSTSAPRRAAASTSTTAHAVALRVCVLTCKLATQCIEQRGVDFAPFAGAFVRAAGDLLRQCASDDAEAGATTRAMTLVGAALDSAAVRTSPAMAAFVAVEPLVQLVDMLTTRFCTLRDAELTLWRDEPELFYADADAEGGLATPRASAKWLVLRCLGAAPELAAPLAALLQRLVRASSRLALGAYRLLAQINDADAARASGAAAVPFEAARALDACYSVAGAAAYELHYHIDFGAWYCERLAPLLDAVAGDGGAVLLQRRVVLLLCDWLNDVGASLRAPVCRSLTTLVASEQADLVVRLTAAHALRTCASLLRRWRIVVGALTRRTTDIRDSLTAKEAVVPLLPTLTGAVLQLMRLSHELESKQMLLTCVNAVVDRYGALLSNEHRGELVRVVCFFFLCYRHRRRSSASSFGS